MSVLGERCINRILFWAAQSGKSVAVFCQERDLRVWQFYESKKRLREAGAAVCGGGRQASEDTLTEAVRPAIEGAAEEWAKPDLRALLRVREIEA